MNQEYLTIGQKRVLVSSPYEAKLPSLVGRQSELELIAASWMAGRGNLPLSPLLLGEPGVGKNHIIYEMAQRTRKPLWIFQGHEDVTAEDLACAVRFSDQGDRKMDYVISPLVTAMRMGGICFIDEIAKIRPRALALLVSVLDDRRYIDSTLLGERVHAEPGFRFIAATNTADVAGNTMPEFLRSRMRPVITVGYPQPEQIDHILTTRFTRFQDRLEPLIEHFWSLWRQHDRRTPPTPRDTIYVFELALSLADLERMDGEGKTSLDPGAAVAMTEERHLARAFHELFPQDTAEAQ